MAALEKLKIEAYEHPDYDHDQVQKVGDTFEVMFNPESYKRKFQIEYEETKGKGQTAKSQKFKGIKEEDFQLKFILDGTGIATAAAGEIPKPFDVPKEIQKLLALTGKVVSDSHRTHYLKVFWGDLVLRCVLDSVEIDYTLFDSSGKPLRATVNARFKGVKSDLRRAGDDRKNSPDLTHVRMIKKNERLDNLSFEIYRDPSYYLKLAKFNDLVSFRNIPMGKELKFPPLKNKKGNDE